MKIEINREFNKKFDRTNGKGNSKNGRNFDRKCNKEGSKGNGKNFSIEIFFEKGK